MEYIRTYLSVPSWLRWRGQNKPRWPGTVRRHNPTYVHIALYAPGNLKNIPIRIVRPYHRLPPTIVDNNHRCSPTSSLQTLLLSKPAREVVSTCCVRAQENRASIFARPGELRWSLSQPQPGTFANHDHRIFRSTNPSCISPQRLEKKPRPARRALSLA